MTYARNHALGRYGEQVAAVHLESLGMAVIDRNWRCRHGEIDLVARDGTTVVVCEVKTRTGSRYGGPFEAITTHKATRLRRLACAWLEEHGVDDHGVEAPSVRIDAISVVVPRRGRAEVVRIAGIA